MDLDSKKHGCAIVRQMIKSIYQNKEYLSTIDGAIGDGDHGVNMNKGFSLCAERLQGNEDLSQALELLGTILFSEIGGSMGPLYGNLLLEMANTCKGLKYIELEDFATMLSAGRSSIEEISTAKLGDKSLLDTLIPAEKGFIQAKEEGKTMPVCLKEMIAAAELGKDSTKNLVAKVGRASRLGERSLGFLDAGATSCYLLLEAMGQASIAAIEQDISS